MKLRVLFVSLLLLIFTLPALSFENSPDAMVDPRYQLIQETLPKVVMIEVEVWARVNNAVDMLITESTGSGVFIEPGNRIITNYHVIEYMVAALSLNDLVEMPSEDEANRILTDLGMRAEGPLDIKLKPPVLRIILDSGQEVEGKVTYTDASVDLALIKTSKTYPYVKVGSLSKKINGNEYDGRGREIITIGSPWGFRNAIGVGVIAYIDPNRDFHITTQILPGSSGGGVFDAETGELIGITTEMLIIEIPYGEEGKKTITEYIGWAIGVNKIKSFLEKATKS